MSAARPQGGENQRKVLALAIVLLVLAGGIFFAYLRSSSDPEAEARAKTVSNPAAQIKAIQDNPNMPPEAKQMAIGQLQSHQNVNMGQQKTGQ